MKLLLLLLLWLSITRWSADAAGEYQYGCCLSYSRPRAVRWMVGRGGSALCFRQQVTEMCNIDAVILKWRRRSICVNPNDGEIRKLLTTLCGRRRVQRREKKHNRLQRRRLKI